MTDPIVANPAQALPTKIYAQIRALRPFQAGKHLLVKGEPLVDLCFISEETFKFLKANLRWSAFTVVQVREDEIKPTVLARLGSTTAEQIAGMEDLKSFAEGMEAANKTLRRQLRELKQQAQDYPAIIASLTPDHLKWLPQDQALDLLAAARATMAARTAPVDPAKAAAQAAIDARDDALDDLTEIDGIGEVIAAVLVDDYQVTSRHRLAAVLADERSRTRLLADLGRNARITPQELDRWAKQIEPDPAPPKKPQADDPGAPPASTEQPTTTPPPA